MTPKPPPFYFEPASSASASVSSKAGGTSAPLVSIGSYADKAHDNKSVRFTMSEETRLAAKDYREEEI